MSYQAPHRQPGPLDRLLPRLGWSPPRQTFLLLEGQAAQLASMNWPERFPFPAGYQLVPWRADYVATSQRSFRLETTSPQPCRAANWKPRPRLALLHHGNVVGWVLVDRTSANATRISSLFVAKGHRPRGQALTLLIHAFRQQHAAGIPIARAAVAPHSQAMLRLVDRHLGAHLKSVTAARSSQLTLKTAGAQQR